MRATALLTGIALAFTTLSAQAATCRAPHMSTGVPYKAARDAAMTAGFNPPALPASGYVATDAKVKQECSGDVALCNRYPELESCGSGHCAMLLTDSAGHTLRIVTYGEIRDGSAKVVSFEMRCRK